MAQVSGVRWWEPYGVTVRRSWGAVQALAPRRTFWIRASMVPFAMLAIFVAVMMWRYPSAPIPWRQLVVAMVSWPLYLVVMVAMFVAFPRSVDVDLKRILVVHGQSETRITPQQLVGVTIGADSTPAVLRLTYMTRAAWRIPSRQASLEVAIGRKTDLAELIDLLTRFRASAAAAGDGRDGGGVTAA